MRRIAIALTPCVINWLACAVFLLTRPPASGLVHEREIAQQAGTLEVSSGDPYMLIAERPLRQWNSWHGDEATWVKIFELINAPGVIAAKRVGDRWAGNHAFSGRPTYRRESWIRAYAFLAVSSLQWLLIGLLLLRLLQRRLRRHSEAAATH